MASESQLCATHRALKVSESYALEQVTVPTPSPSSLKGDEILIEVHSAGVNHIENYFIDRKNVLPGYTLGTTAGGKVIAVGPNVTRFRQGDTIGAFVFAGDKNYPERGTFQKYVVVYECNAVNVPLIQAPEEENIPAGKIDSFEAIASAIGNIVTVGASIYYEFGHVNEPRKTILIYGGATGVGQLAIGYCHHIGWRVITVASIKHREYLQSLGADVVIDYHTDDLAGDISALGEDIDFYYTTAGGVDAVKQVYASIPEDKDVKFESLEVPDLSFIEKRKKNVSFGFTRAFTCHGRTITYGSGEQFEPRAGIYEKIVQWMPIAEQLIKDGIFIRTPIRVIPGGLDGVAQGMLLLKEKQVSNLRLVIRL